MARLVFAFCLMIALPASATSCVTPIPDRYQFFRDAESVFFARAEVLLEDPYVFRAGEILHGAMRIGETVSVPRRTCLFVRDQERYLVVRGTCDRSEECVRFAGEAHVPALLHYFSNAHPETHEDVMATFLRWYRDEIPLAELGEWMETVSAQPRSKVDDELVLWLAAELSDVAADLRTFAEQLERPDAFTRPVLHEVARLMEEFPPGLAADFDGRVDPADEDALQREDLEDQLSEAIAAAQKSADWSRNLEEAYDRQGEIPPR